MRIFLVVAALTSAVVVLVFWPILSTAALPLTAVVTALSVLCLLVASVSIVIRGRPSRDHKRVVLATDPSILSMYAEDAFRPALIVSKNRISHANLAFLREMGFSRSREAIVGLPVAKIVRPSDHSKCWQYLSQQTNAEYPLAMVRTDGSCWQTLATFIPGTEAGVRLLQFTERTVGDATPTLDDAESLSIIAQYMGDVLFALDEKLLIAYMSTNGSADNSDRANRVVGRPFLQLFHSEDRPRLLRTLREGLRTAKTLSPMEGRMTSGAGAYRWFEVRAYTVAPAPGGQVANSGPFVLAGVMIDVTVRKLHEQSLYAQRRSLRTLVDNMPGMIYRGYIDRHWSLEFVSEGCLELTGYGPAELVTSGNVTLGDLIHEEDREYVWTKVQMQLSRIESYELTYRIVDRNDNIKWVAETGRGVYSAAGELLGIEGFIIDITARQLAHEDSRRRLFYDATTGLLNRSVFMDRLCFMISHAAVWKHRFAVVYVQLVLTSPLTPTLGQDNLDRLMVELGKRLAPFNKDCNGIARYEELGFLCLLSGGGSSNEEQDIAGNSATSFDDFEQLICSILDVVRAPVRLAHQELIPVVRYGVTWSRADPINSTGMIAEAINASSAG